MGVEQGTCHEHGRTHLGWCQCCSRDEILHHGVRARNSTFALEARLVLEVGAAQGAKGVKVEPKAARTFRAWLGARMTARSGVAPAGCGSGSTLGGLRVRPIVHEDLVGHELD